MNHPLLPNICLTEIANFDEIVGRELRSLGPTGAITIIGKGQTTITVISQDYFLTLIETLLKYQTEVSYLVNNRHPIIVLSGVKEE
jgi:hypothetical protein